MAVYFIIMSVIAFCLFGVDKYRAQHDQWRIPNKVLLGVSAVGGAFGALIAMYLFRHKTRQKMYTASLPVMLLAHAALLHLMG